MSSYIESRTSMNLRPIKLPNKDKFYFDLLNIEHSWSGRNDVWGFGNTFIMESAQLLINAIVLFEQGYFDCAYYSLRSSIEISTTIVFLSDMPDEEKETFFNAWKQTENFPMQSNMLKLLSQKGNIFADMKKKLEKFFEEVKDISAEINKYVHKQGFRHFYVSRNHPLKSKDSQENFINNFEYYLKKCIGIVAVMRLAIDPFPVLLMDEDILYRCFNSLTDSYKYDFVNEYIGDDILSLYKETEIYKEVYNTLINNEKRTPAVFSVTKHHYINTNKIDEIFNQIALLTKWDIVSVILVFACEKIVKVYCANGFEVYFTNKNTNRKALSWNSEDFLRFAKSENKTNQPYDEAYISVFEIDSDPFFIEHNELLASDETDNIHQAIKEYMKENISN